ncbi:GNAT family N-acetyltransferase [Flagellimonas lutaonensis]|uniref:Cellulose biosynthesis protein n=1 Tax=Flagellimonas lutaonensis TaxID=516051 RepID=A0A0D5YV14_9FLAO|nr:GNAT family N-acetyltransferase [Allomuricauda lutaonensis]AKA36060.1 Cellulose biosynthesis protein [Allomuricauda lutaonensis]
MGTPSIIALDFFGAAMENGEIPSIIQSIGYFGKTIQNDNISHSTEKVINCYSLRLVPEYMQLQIVSERLLATQVVKQFNWGYSIHLDNIASIDEYLKRQFKSKYRSIIRRYVNRLEHCFPIKYKLFYGEIDEKTYRFIMGSLHQMIIARFGQRKETHKEFHRWETLVNETRPKILNKQASLFVIYDGEHPIQISLNYHFDKILFSAISSYDINYAKFGLGHVEIYKQLQWCIENDHCVYEMGVGGMDYKRRWSNNIYQYQHHIVYRKNKPLTRLLANIEIVRISAKEYLKSKNVNELVYKLKDFIIKKKNDRGHSPQKVSITEVDVSVSITGYHTLELPKSKNHFLKKYMCDFLYSKVEQYSDVAILQSKKNQNIYLFKGKSNAQQLVFGNKKGA